MAETTTTEYAVLLPGDESRWEHADDRTRAEVYARHARFMQLLRERGHTVTGGAELDLSKHGHVVRGSLDDVTVTEGPYAETAEQLTGFYLVRTADPDDLMAVCGLLTDGGTALEVRAVVPEPAPESYDVEGLGAGAQR